MKNIEISFECSLYYMLDTILIVNNLFLFINTYLRFLLFYVWFWEENILPPVIFN